MKVATGALTLDLRFCEIVIRDVAKIAAKRQYDPLKSHMNRYTEEESWERINIETPLGLAMSQALEMKTVTGIGIESVEPQPEFAQDVFMGSLEKPSY